MPGLGGAGQDQREFAVIRYRPAPIGKIRALNHRRHPEVLAKRASRGDGPTARTKAFILLGSHRAPSYCRCGSSSSQVTVCAAVGQDHTHGIPARRSEVIAAAEPFILRGSLRSRLRTIEWDWRSLQRALTHPSRTAPISRRGRLYPRVKHVLLQDLVAGIDFLQRHIVAPEIRQVLEHALGVGLGELGALHHMVAQHQAAVAG